MSISWRYFNLLRLNNSIIFKYIDINLLFPRKYLTLIRKFNVKIRDGVKSVFINEYKHLKHLEKKMLHERLSSNNTDSCTNNEKIDNINC